jgi:hypothetical protein
MKQLTWILLLLLGIAVVASARERPFDPGREGIVVIGIAPADISMTIAMGEIVRERWKSTRNAPVFVGAASDGFLVVRVPANRQLAIRSVRPVDKSRSSFWICGYAFTPTFSVPAGKVLYVGDFMWKWPEDLDPWVAPAEPDLARARQYVDARYPEHGGKLEAGQFKMMRTRTSCSATNGSLSLE